MEKQNRVTKKFVLLQTKFSIVKAVSMRFKEGNNVDVIEDSMYSVL